MRNPTHVIYAAMDAAFELLFILLLHFLLVLIPDTPAFLFYLLILHIRTVRFNTAVKY
jgi:hypothetical protein